MGIWDNFEDALGTVAGGTKPPRYIWEDGSVHDTPEPPKLIRYTFQDGSVWLVDPNTYEKRQMIEGPKASGGGNTTINYNTQAANDLGPNRYKVRVSDGSDGFPAGTTYQIDMLDGSISSIKYPTAASTKDPDGDGYDNSSGLPVGVVRDSKSPSGYLYQGKAVNADGSLYSGTNSDAPDLVNGKYIWDPVAKKYVIAPGMESPSSSSANISISGLKSTAGSGGGGGGGSSAVERDYAAEAAADDARSLANQKELMLLADKLKNDPNNPYLIMQQQQLQLEAQSLAQRSQESAAERRLRTIKDFESAVSDTDQAKLTARRLALGNGTGDVSIADLLRNTEGGFQATDAAAALLAEIRGQGGGAPMPGILGQFGITQMNPVSQSPSGGTAGVPAGGGSVGTSTPGAANVPGQPATPMTPVSTGPTMNQRLQQYAVDTAEREKQAAYSVRSGWEPVSTPNGIVYQEFTNGQPTGKQMTQAQFNAYYNQTNPEELGNPSMQEQIRNALQMAQERENQYQQVQDWTQAPKDISAGFQTASGGTDYRDRGTASSTNSGATVYKMPGVGWVDVNQTPVMPVTGNLADDQIQRGIDLKPKAVLPEVRGYARGGMAPVGQPAIVGERGPELMLPTPEGTIVRPMHPVQAQSMLEQGTPGYADGTYLGGGGAYLNPDGTAYTPVTTGSRTRTPSVTRTVAPMQPVSTVQAPAQGTVIPYAPPQNNVTPAVPPTYQNNPPQYTGQATVPNNPVTGQPYQAPMQPVSPPVPQTAGGTAAPTQPAFNPAQPTAVTPEQQAYLDEIRRFRDSQNNLQDVNPLDVSFGRMAPTYQQAYYEQMKTRTGIPIEDQLAEQRRYQMAGRGRAMAPLGY